MMDGQDSSGLHKSFIVLLKVKRLLLLVTGREVKCWLLCVGGAAVLSAD